MSSTTTLRLDCRACFAEQTILCEIDNGSCVGIWPCADCGADPGEDEARYAADAEHEAAEGRAYMRGGYAR